ncbi:hypothetical protein EVAR_53302_1 [Eumeta japonica]|uniref:Uncharacterized protein n=1 Tax=Eumeta variegata TaxID=151549 RepID=A0A4C1X9W4_EUMVA|nr:hypothetical protein EVAR_53302_1 [Eumeta japonica]
MLAFDDLRRDLRLKRKGIGTYSGAGSELDQLCRRGGLHFAIADINATTKLPEELKTQLKQRYGSDPRVLPTFDRLVEFLKDECRFLESISRDIRELSGSPGRRVTPNQRAENSGSRIETPPSLRWESNPKPRPIYAAEQDQK